MVLVMLKRSKILRDILKSLNIASYFKLLGFCNEVLKALEMSNA